MAREMTDEVRLLASVREWNVCPETLRHDGALSHLWHNDTRAGWDYLTEAGQQRCRELFADPESGFAEAVAMAQWHREEWARAEAHRIVDRSLGSA